MTGEGEPMTAGGVIRVDDDGLRAGFAHRGSAA